MLDGFGLSGFRSFGPESQFVAPLKRLNLFAGQNNAGKSNILRFVQLLPQLRTALQEERGFAISPLDSHRGDRGATLSLLVPMSGDISGSFRHESELDALQAIRTAIPIQAQGFEWYRYSLAEGVRVSPRSKDFSESGPVSWGDWRIISTALSGRNSYGFGAAEIEEAIRLLNPLGLWSLPSMGGTIEAHRRIGDPEGAWEGLSGTGLIQKLGELERPVLSEQSDKELFQKVVSFVREVTGQPSAELEVARKQPQLLVRLGKRLLPIENLGTGIAEVVLFAVAATVVQDSIICIEEPEIHLHPRLQKQLMRYLADKTTNQYFITTHSGHILDTPGAALFHVSLNEYQESVITCVETESQQVDVCFDLGYRPSDLLQANCVVWVEGPSDRIYLNSWIKAKAPELLEGIHYTIMFYGGRLLSHLGTADPQIDHQVEPFINLLKINRRPVVVMDSDRKTETESIGATKQRIVNELEAVGGLAWVTAGREIENYVPASVMADARSSVHPKPSSRETILLGPRHTKQRTRSFSPTRSGLPALYVRGKPHLSRWTWIRRSQNSWTLSSRATGRHGNPPGGEAIS